MNKKLFKHAVCFLTLLLLFAPVVTFAQNFGESYIDQINVGSTNSDLPGIVINIINVVLGFLALIAVIFVIIGGFEWMTAGGNEEQVKRAQTRLKNGLIGLVIIFLAYGIVTFVLDKLQTVS